MTRDAPSVLASCTASSPIAEAAPVTSTRWPAVNPPWVTRASCSVAIPTGRAAASVQVSDSDAVIAWRWSASA
jgi:hypothetical protein